MPSHTVKERKKKAKKTKPKTIFGAMKEVKKRRKAAGKKGK